MKTYNVEGFGIVGEANLIGFVVRSGKPLATLEIGESSTGTITKQERKTEEIRVTRLT